VIVKSSTPEFDYPTGKDNVYANYYGVDGIDIHGAVWRTLFAWYLDDVNILLSRYIINDSRIMLHRNIQDRVQTIAPFLQLDHDPYVVISNGRLYWIQDAYTTSGWFPYAQPQSNGDINYIRNSVKVVIDAYDGTVTFYVVDAADQSSRLTGASSPRCSRLSMPCRRICKGTSATRRICSLSRLNSTALTTWMRLKCSTIAKTSGSFPASRPAPTATTSAAALG
jgi:uncharacterized membrane protein (UPF0182 family)